MEYNFWASFSKGGSGSRCSIGGLPTQHMEQLLICLSLALIAGLLMSRLAKVVHLPAVTSYLVAGLLLGPFFLGKLGLSGWGIGFGSIVQVEGYGIITQVALGMAAEAAELSDGHMVRNVVLFSVLVYELVGPTLTKFSLTAAGEIEPEGRTSARTANKPEAPVTLD